MPGSNVCPELLIDIPLCEPHVDRLLESPAEKLRCRVKRYRERSLLELHVEEGNVFVLSALKSGKDWFISEQPGGSAKNYIARLRAQKDGSFSCVRACDEKRSMASELALVTHATESLGESLPELNTMRAALPRLSESGVDAPSGVLAAQLRQHNPRGCHILESRKPKWNARTDSFELPFAGRANFASARNFQLLERSGSDWRANAAAATERAVLLYGKLEENEFALDFERPLSVLQALAIVLTTSGW